MKLGLLAGVGGRHVNIPLDRIALAESLGFDSVWTSEAWGSDAITTATWILANSERIKVGTAIMQMPARTPALTAMTAMSLAQLSGGRFIVGLGASGPQVVEGWHGVAYGRPITRLKEYVTVMRKIFAREEPLTFDGKQYQLPFTGESATGLGRPLKSMLHCSETIPIYAASISPRGVRAAAEVADGFFPIWHDPEKFEVFKEPIEDGFSAAGNKTLADFDIAPFVTVALGDDLAHCMMPIKANLALYIGGMGAKDKNFYNDYTKRLGFEEAANTIQAHFLAGRREEAVAAVPDELVDAVHLIGPAERIRERATRWIEAAKRGEVGTMMIGATSPEAMKLIAEIIL